MEQEYDDEIMNPDPETVLQFLAFCLLAWQDQENRPVAVNNTTVQNLIKASYNTGQSPYITVEHKDNITKLIAEMRDNEN